MFSKLYRAARKRYYMLALRNLISKNPCHPDIPHVVSKLFD